MSAPIYVDAKGLKCPMPVIHLQKHIRQAGSGDELQIDCTDMSAEKDIASWCKVNKHTLLKVEHTEFGLSLFIQAK